MLTDALLLYRMTSAKIFFVDKPVFSVLQPCRIRYMLQMHPVVGLCDTKIINIANIRELYGTKCPIGRAGSVIHDTADDTVSNM